MSGSTISTTIHSTVTLGTSGYTSPLTFTSTGGAAPTLSGDAAVKMPVPGGSIENAGALLGATGVSRQGARASNGGSGGIGINLTASGTVDNTGTVAGGRGGLASGYASRGKYYLGDGGTGGIGVVLADGGMITNDGKILGGEGGNYIATYDGYTQEPIYGEGGNGGIGVVMAGGTLLNQAIIEGGVGFEGGAGGAGISVSSAGTVVNTGTIAGGDGGFDKKSRVDGNGGVGAVVAAQSRLTNDGLITGGYGTRSVYYNAGGYGGAGASLKSGALLINHGTVAGGQGGFANVGGSGVVLLGQGTLRNYGEITSSDGAAGVVLRSSGLVANYGTITGGVGSNVNAGRGGDGLDAAAGLRLLNTGSIMAGAGVDGGHAADGVSVSGIGSIENTGYISGSVGGGQGQFYDQGTGGVGIYLEGGTLFNSGTIAGGIDAFGSMQGTLCDAVEFGSLAATLIIAPGAVFDGSVVAPGTSLDVIELTGSSADIGTLSGLGSEFTGFETLDVDAGASWAISGKIFDLLNDGQVNILSGTDLDITGGVIGSSTGIFELTDNATLDIASLWGSTTQIEFLGGTHEDSLVIGNPSRFGLHVASSDFAGPTLEDFKAGDSIDLKRIGSVGLSLNYNSLSGVLQVSSGSGGIVASLQFQNSSLGAGTFGLTSDGATGSLVTLSG